MALNTTVTDSGIIHVTSDEALRPCPFCGEVHGLELTHSWTAAYWVECPCGVQVDGEYGGDIHPDIDSPDYSPLVHEASARSAIDRWNHRVATS